MDKWDIATVIGAIIAIIIIAFFLNPGTQNEDSAEGITIVPPFQVGTPSMTVVPDRTTSTTVAVESGKKTLLTPSQIYYDRNYFSYPLFIFPEYSPYFEASSDAPWSGSEVVEFAYMSEATGGVSQIFNVPYRIWKINCTINAETNPAYAKIKWMLVNAKSGSIIKGVEFYGSGTIYKTVLTYQTDMYFVVEPTKIDYYTIKLETTENYL